MKIRRAILDDYQEICGIYRSARKFMAENGNFSQLNDVPALLEQIRKDILVGNFYVCTDEDDRIIGSFCFFTGSDPTYAKIYDGKWLNESPYGVIHRIASAERGKGIASFCISWCVSQHGNIKIDTHRDNIPMRNTILKNGFTYCGIIRKEDGTERLAYQIVKR